eukprot:9474897-Pyramimonas_sp.AAC.1
MVPDEHGSISALVHRRSRKVAPPRAVATPGGSIDPRDMDAVHKRNLGLDNAASYAACRELRSWIER